MLLYIIIVGILVFINPILGAVGVFACVGIHILKSVAFGGRKKESEKRDDVPQTECDEFDWWQDNQGL